ncbi:adventurous gliding motility lipoprotein CglB [Archangium primigenium]|uniref:adventurous gliding motility lipoprotein CglB n=1 Tax=[Archangium] primigenium TaxID=2792470 RepID=UPI00195941CD|nr:adventurous gliding motility lipoprotein CglB [Archangium primigenium]MBM7115422.1 adventurous gliding motility lipoprotein CglB [Archangium primigenium]
MRAKLSLLSFLAVSALSGVLATACQTYDFEPVEPLAIAQTTETRVVTAKASKPNLMLLVDTSGSMTAPVDPSRPACTTGRGLCGSESNPCNTATCPTRWSELQAAMSDFLDSSGSIARIGLTTYPDQSQGDSCGATSSLSVPLPADTVEDATQLVANANQVKTRLLAIKNSSTTNEQVPVGGTPTSLSLRYVGNLADLQSASRSSFVLLLTDGLPNCNSQFADPYPSPKCFCTLTASCEGAPDIGCLDTDASVAAVQALQAKKIQTIVIGFGADFNSSSESGRRGVATLNGMADAGGFARECTTDAQCGAGDRCETSVGKCERRFYQAANRTELVNALREITDKVTVDEPCVLSFSASEQPSSEELLVVYINGERLAPGANTWNLTPAGVAFNGTTCERITNSTPSNPVNIEVRAVQRR